MVRRIFDRPFSKEPRYRFVLYIKRVVQRADVGARRVHKPCRRLYWPNRDGANYKCLAWAFRGPWKGLMDV